MQNGHTATTISPSKTLPFCSIARHVCDLVSGAHGRFCAYGEAASARNALLRASKAAPLVHVCSILLDAATQKLKGLDQLDTNCLNMKLSQRPCRTARDSSCVAVHAVKLIALQGKAEDSTIARTPADCVHRQFAGVCCCGSGCV